MCGLVGAAGPLTGKHEKAVKQMLIFDSIRGEDSTGVAVVNRKGDEIILAKQVGDPFQLFYTKQFELAFKRVNKVIIGHNRYATQGKVNRQNAHPYEFDSLVGAHNGTLTSKYCLVDATRFDVDSENLYHHIDKKGLRDALDNMTGAWALVWWDKHEEEIKFLRNKERPLYLCNSDDGVLFWASEPWMLSVALNRNEIKHTEPKLIPEDQLYSFYVDEKGEVEKPRVSPAASTKKEYVYQGNNRGDWNNQVHSNTTSNVVQLIETKKEGVIPQQVRTTPKEEYSPLLEISLKVFGKGLDKFGNQFWKCKDFLHVARDIRLYIKRDDKYDLMDKIILAKMHQFPFRAPPETNAYWKVEHSTVRLAPNVISTEGLDEVIPDAVVVKDMPIDDNGRPFYQDAKGKLISRKDWEAKHGKCAWCSNYVDPETEFKFTREGDAVCHLCSDDPEVKNFVNFR